MDAALIAACEAFSVGDSHLAMAHIDAAVQWEIVGDHRIIGRDGVEQACTEAAQAGTPDFTNHRVHAQTDTVIVEGSNCNGDLHYCDIYRIREGRIQTITSYCLSALEDTP
jgi:ketosteroid isomerase-like protein